MHGNPSKRFQRKRAKQRETETRNNAKLHPPVILNEAKNLTLIPLSFSPPRHSEGVKRLKNPIILAETMRFFASLRMTTGCHSQLDWESRPPFQNSKIKSFKI
jgi:hypothetical protein